MEDRVSEWNGTIREPLFTAGGIRLKRPVGIRPEHLLIGLRQVCGTWDIPLRTTPIGVHYGVACVSVVIEHEKWKIRLVTEDNDAIPMPLSPQEALPTPVLPAVFFLCIFADENWPKGRELERAIAELRLLLVGNGRARGFQLLPVGGACLQRDLQTELGSQFEPIPPQ